MFRHSYEIENLDAEETETLLRHFLHRMDQDAFLDLAKRHPAIARKLRPQHYLWAGPGDEQVPGIPDKYTANMPEADRKALAKWMTTPRIGVVR